MISATKLSTVLVLASLASLINAGPEPGYGYRHPYAYRGYSGHHYGGARQYGNIRYGYNSHYQGYNNYHGALHPYQYSVQPHHPIEPVPIATDLAPQEPLVIKELPSRRHPQPIHHEEVVHQQVIPAGEVVLGEESHIVNPLPGQFVLPAEDESAPLISLEEQQFLAPAPEEEQPLFFQAPLGDVQQVIVPDDLQDFSDGPNSIFVGAPQAFVDPRGFAPLDEGQFVIPAALPAFPAVPEVLAA